MADPHPQDLVQELHVAVHGREHPASPYSPSEVWKQLINDVTRERRMDAGTKLVQGRCMACGSQSLFLADGGHVTCSRSDCPDPTAVTDWLSRPPHHEALLSDAGWSLQHPVTCFPDLTKCAVHDALFDWARTVVGPTPWHGRYFAAVLSDGTLRLTDLPDE